MASATLTRRTQSVGVAERKATLARDGFIGCYYSLRHAAKAAPAILYLGSSSAGLPCSIEASLLASHGYPVLVLAYDNVTGLPARLDRTPLEYFKHALQWLARRPGVNANRIVTMGTSKEGEAALLLGASYPSLVHGAIDYVDSSSVDSAYPYDATSWTLNGKPIPTGSVIPIWKINGPLLLVGGNDHRSGAGLTPVENTVSLLKTHHKHDYTALVYKHAGHTISWGVPNLPFGTTYLHVGIPHYMGGTLAADAAARSDSWPKLLAFLKRLR